MPIDKFSGPIPGENYTSDTKNYAWHRPPEHTNLDKAIETIAKKLMSEESYTGVLTMLENGMTVSQLTEIFLMSGVGNGKWTPDFALLLAGPTSHIVKLMAEGYGIKYEMGIDDKIKGPSKAYFEGFKTVNKKQVENAVSEVDIKKIKVKASGFMGMGADEETKELLKAKEDMV